MIQLIKESTYLLHGEICIPKASGTIEKINTILKEKNHPPVSEKELKEASKGTIAYGILEQHQQEKKTEKWRLRFDSLASHDITYVGIIQTAMASGLKEFPVPYVLTNCHNSLCAVGGTINSDDQSFGLSAAKKFGGIFVPAHQAVIHSFMRENFARCGAMIMGSDSHTRYGALGTMAVGEGGPEIVKQLLSQTYDLDIPEVVGVYLTGSPGYGVGPHDVALALIGSVFDCAFVKNAILEFVGPGIEHLSMDFRNGVDVMTTETTCWSTIWQTDDEVKRYLQIHGREEDYQRLVPKGVAEYARMIHIDLSRIKPMIALPFHPSHVYTIEAFKENAEEILMHTEAEAKKRIESQDLSLSLMDKLDSKKRLRIDQGVIAGCAGGTFENIVFASRILRGASVGNHDFSLSIYPGSQPINLELMREGVIEELMMSGASIRTAFCGPCFGAGDTPSHQGFSIRHTTRNFPNREGSKPGEGQVASVALMDARSIAATAKNKGVLTAANEVNYDDSLPAYQFDPTSYHHRVYQGYGQACPEETIVFGPNIAPWPPMGALEENLLLQVASVILDPVTTTDELMPSGETSSLRSNPIRLSEFTLSRKDPGYLQRAKKIQDLEEQRSERKTVGKSLDALEQRFPWAIHSFDSTQIGSVVVAMRPGDGSAREQAASGQKVLGGLANISVDYATKRYRSNLINWGMLPLLAPEAVVKEVRVGDYFYIPHIRAAIREGQQEIPASWITLDGQIKALVLSMGDLSTEEREILLAGSLINYYGKS